MREVYLILRSIPVILLLGCVPAPSYRPANGDIIFQTSKSAQSSAIQLATNSPYSHMGIVYVRDGETFVFEAVEPVKSTPLGEWLARGEAREYVVKRLRNASTVITPAALARMEEVGRQFEGKHYDRHFEWSDDRMYCSELVWKIYERALGVRIGQLEVLGDFDLSSDEVRKELQNRWGSDLPLQEVVISPAAIYESDNLVEVYRCTAS